MTYGEICTVLRNAGVENAEWDALLLLEHFSGADRSRVLFTPEQDYRSDELFSAIQKRAQRVPLQYLLGEWAFYRQTYEVSPDCLIPRPDTELLVEEAVRTLPQGAFFADLCTGSGCIAVSVLAERSDTRAVAVDLSAAALAVAKRNASRNGVSNRFFGVRADVLRPAQALFRIFPKPAAILSNPYGCARFTVSGGQAGAAHGAGRGRRRSAVLPRPARHCLGLAGSGRLLPV